MPYTIGPVGEFGLDGSTFAMRVTCPSLTQRQFAWLVGHLDAIGLDTYPDFSRRTTLFTFAAREISVGEVHDYLDEQIIGKFTSRCCDPRSDLYLADLADDSPATDAELLAIVFPA